MERSEERGWKLEKETKWNPSFEVSYADTDQEEQNNELIIQYHIH